jgi:hypothetical protein
LAIALVHQLGACPCGCIEGNLWVQSFLRLIGGVQRVSAADPTSLARTSVDSQECEDEHGDLAYVSDGGMTHAHAPGSLATAWALPALEGAVASGVRFSRAPRPGDDWPGPQLSARTLRAQLQIFLI